MKGVTISFPITLSATKLTSGSMDLLLGKSRRIGSVQQEDGAWHWTKMWFRIICIRTDTKNNGGLIDVID